MNLLKTLEVSEKLGMTRPALHMLRARDTTFPKPIVLSNRVLRWDEAEVETWITKKKESEHG
tara:strand:+ start:447 stop:632 length:186 start_codon:yes stop_codon:yes gene_type:complete